MLQCVSWKHWREQAANNLLFNGTHNTTCNCGGIGCFFIAFLKFAINRMDISNIVMYITTIGILEVWIWVNFLKEEVSGFSHENLIAKKNEVKHSLCSNVSSSFSKHIILPVSVDPCCSWVHD